MQNGTRRVPVIFGYLVYPKHHQLRTSKHGHHFTKPFYSRLMHETASSTVEFTVASLF